MKTYLLKREQLMPIPLEEAWDFFSSPLNLAKITPEEMNFQLTSSFNADTKMYEGMLITYKITPLFGIKMDWMTEITHVREHDYFVDEQRFGPYALWHHEHHFKKVTGGTHMSDVLYYAIPYGAIGRLANSLLVKKEVERIFTYREKAITEMFGTIKQPKL